MDNLVIQFGNAHGADCGGPPRITASRESTGMYYGYFENEHGEQWVFTYDRAMKIAILRGGDIGWDHSISLAGPQDFGGAVFGSTERAWLAACWGAARAMGA